MGKSSYGKSASRYSKPAGLYQATVTRVAGVDVYVQVPRLTLDFEHGPIPYTGIVPAVGSKVFVGFLEGSQDDVVGLFISDSAGGGKLDPTLTVAAYNSPQDVRDASDYVCTGVNDHLTIMVAMNALFNAVPSVPGRIQLTSGNYDIAPDHTVPELVGVDVKPRFGLVGVGPSTVLDIKSSSDTTYQDGVTLDDSSTISSLTVSFANNARDRLYGVKMVGIHATMSDCHFIGMDTSGMANTFYGYIDFGGIATNCIVEGLSDQITAPTQQT